MGLGSSPGLLCRIMISFVIWPTFYVLFSSAQPRPRPPAHSRRPARPARRKSARPPPRLPSALPVALAMWAWPRTRCYRCMLPAPIVLLYFKRYAHAAGPFNIQFRGGRYWFQLGMHNPQRTTRAAVEALHFRYRASHIHARTHFELTADLSSESDSCACQALGVRTSP